MAVTITRPQAVACVGWFPWPTTSSQDQDEDQDGDAAAEEIEGESPFLMEDELVGTLEAAEDIVGESPALNELELEEARFVAAKMEADESPCVVEEDLDMDDDEVGSPPLSVSSSSPGGIIG